jgi:hypothetical protein
VPEPAPEPEPEPAPAPAPKPAVKTEKGEQMRICSSCIHPNTMPLYPVLQQ